MWEWSEWWGLLRSWLRLVRLVGRGGIVFILNGPEEEAVCESGGDWPPEGCPQVSVCVMVARTDAAAYSSSPYLCYFCLFVCLSCIVRSSTYTTVRYSCLDILDIGSQMNMTISWDFHRTHNIPDKIARPTGSPWIVVGSNRRRGWWRERKQKRGCRAGLLARLRKQPLRPPLPNLYLTNARSMVRKTSGWKLLCLGLLRAYHHTDLATYTTPGCRGAANRLPATQMGQERWLWEEQRSGALHLPL